MSKTNSKTSPVVSNSVSILTSAAMILAGLGVLAACSSEPKLPPAPEWVSQPSRTLDNGYIVYIAESEASSQSRAQLQAEGTALEDLANECSMVPKGTRVEDRYHVKTKTGNHVYVKIAVEFQECNDASKTNDPALIKQIANVQFTEQLKRYQDLEETGDMPDSTAVASIAPPSEVQAAPAQGGMNNDTHYYVVRQYVAYQKEIVVLSPPNSYQPASPESTHFITQVQPATAQVASYQAANPALKTNPQVWSKVPDRPHMDRPTSLMSQSTRTHNAEPRARSSGHPNEKSGEASHAKKRRRRSHM